MKQLMVGAPLGVVFAHRDEIAHLKTSGVGCIPLTAGDCLVTDDTYLVLSDDVRRWLYGPASASPDGLGLGLADALVVSGTLQLAPPRTLLQARSATTVEALLSGALPYAAEIPVHPGVVAMREINALPHLRHATQDAPIGPELLTAAVDGARAGGTAPLTRTGGAAPGRLWARSVGPDETGVELAVFADEDGPTAVLRPLKLLH